MEGYIDEYGRLWIKRKKEFVQAQCRFTDNNGIPFCDHRCSRFGEPYKGPSYHGEYHGESSIMQGTDLDLCDKTLNFRVFRDLRPD